METRCPTADSAMTVQHLPLSTPYHLQASPSMQLPMQTTYSLSTGPVLASDGSESYDRESEDSTQTTPDKELLLNVAGVNRVARLGSHWFVDVEYEESLLPWEFFGQLLLTNPRLSGLAKAAQFAQGYCRVQWRSDTTSLFEAQLTRFYTDLVLRLGILCFFHDGRDNLRVLFGESAGQRRDSHGGSDVVVLYNFSV